MKAIIFKKDHKYSYGDLIKTLFDLGYDRDDSLSKQGTFAVMGGSITLYATNYDSQIRLDFFGDFLDGIVFLKEKKKIEEIEILPNILELDGKTKIKPGDYVVHEDHGIGLFSNIGIKMVEGKPEVYIFIQYLNNDVLYLPISLKEKISPYIGVGRKKPKLNKLGSQTWKKTYHKTYENVLKFARELIKIYAEREISKKTPWKIDQKWETQIRETFGYQETPDQIEATKAIYNDLSSGKPMDRLIVGDVGFGKTEVALRTAAQACANGFQVAFVVPTTLLAEQHYATIKKRFANLPVVAGHISRLVPSKDSDEIKKGLAEGNIDIIVGTHALLATNLKIKNFGLLIIDEEQKFGVKQKEHLKNLKKDVNVLSLSATPIPRTLFMSLSGLRDISQIYTPPEGRKEINTKVAEYDDIIIKEYIEREINRGGQVYFLHNEVATIVGKKNKLQKIFPNLNIKVAHGQMGEIALAQTMTEFVEGRIDVLVCSTIIENGIDLPNVNTLIVEDADKFGLSQLYQIRGRIGRSKKQAYALFTYPKKKITSNAYKRLKALLDNVELGAGYSIALSDLEIRGGGNVLGREQHGNMESVGLILYSKMLNIAVGQIRAKKL